MLAAKKPESGISAVISLCTFDMFYPEIYPSLSSSVDQGRLSTRHTYIFHNFSLKTNFCLWNFEEAVSVINHIIFCHRRNYKEINLGLWQSMYRCVILTIFHPVRVNGSQLYTCIDLYFTIFSDKIMACLFHLWSFRAIVLTSFTIFINIHEGVGFHPADCKMDILHISVQHEP